MIEWLKLVIITAVATVVFELIGYLWNRFFKK